MANMFAKIAKTFVRLSMTIVAIRRRLILVLHLEAKYTKMDCKNEIYAKKFSKEHLDYKKSTPKESQRLTIREVNIQRKQSQRLVKSTTTGQHRCKQMTSTRPSNDVSR